MANRTDIPQGRDQAISRAALARLWNCEEREVRRTVAALRAHPGDDTCALLSASNNGTAGYWRSDCPEEISRFVRETQARARNTLAALADARRFTARG